jgi:hypothetical protein
VADLGVDEVRSDAPLLQETGLERESVIVVRSQHAYGRRRVQHDLSQR